MNPEQYDEVMAGTGLSGELSKNAVMNNQQNQQQFMMDEGQRSLAEMQTELDSVKETIFHLLKQDREIVQSGQLIWEPMVDKSKLVFTEEGRDKIYQLISFYVNKNTLFTNFDENQIKFMMRRFMTELNGLILLKYEIIFRQPTFDECVDILERRTENKAKLRVYSGKRIGKIYDQKEIEKELLKETETRIEYEIKKIKEQQRKEKIREYGIILVQLEALVYSLLNRAFRGEERGSIRRHQNASEVVVLGERGGGSAKTEQGVIKRFLGGG